MTLNKLLKDELLQGLEDNGCNITKIEGYKIEGYNSDNRFFEINIEDNTFFTCLHPVYTFNKNWIQGYMP